MGAYTNALTPHGLVALWNGVVASGAAATSSNGFPAAPLVSVAGSAAVPLAPDNVAPAAAHICFYEEGAAPQTIGQEEVAAALLS